MTYAKQFTLYIDAKIQGHVVKAGSMEIMLYDHAKGLFHVKSRRGRTHGLNLLEKKMHMWKDTDIWISM